MGELSGKTAAITAKKWYQLYIGILAALLVMIGAVVVILDPFFHYHAPLQGFYYRLSEQRYQNDGITKHFEYDSVITGTSMVENFRTSQFDGLFEAHSIKVPYPGATYREINDNLEKAFATHDRIRFVVRALDYSHLIEDKDLLRSDMGEYPDYLYDRNILNDVKYLYNGTVVGGYVAPMLLGRLSGSVLPGVESFDAYGMSTDTAYSPENALEGKTWFRWNDRDGQSISLTEADRMMLIQNVEQNVTALAKRHPETVFYYFFPPYSAVWFGSLIEEGSFEKQLEAERIASEMMLECGNIRVFSFSADREITCDLNNYKDAGHYGPWVNEYILECLRSGKYEVTSENLEAHLEEQRDLYYGMDFNSLLP